MDETTIYRMKAALKDANIADFEYALDLATEEPNGFTREVLTTVEAAWRSVDSVVNTYGWIVGLKDGRRLYLELIRVTSRAKKTS